MGRIGQFRSSQLSSYSTPLEVSSMSQIEILSNVAGEIRFKNICGILENANILNNDNCYYLKFYINQRSDSTQTFYVKLLNSTLLEDNEQIIGSFNVQEGTSVTYYELIFQPNAIYDTIVFELQRTADDYRLTNGDGTSGRIIEGNITNLEKLINVIDFLKNEYDGLEYLKKIGIQGPVALMFCLNGEQIRVGRNKIYEIHNDYKINFIGFVPYGNYFIMDFEY